MFELEGKSYKVSAVIAAGGSSSRMGFNKLTAFLDGIPVVLRSIAAFERCESVDEIIVVAGTDCAKLVADNNSFAKLKEVVSPGESRQKSVYNGVAASSEDTDIVCIHDGARPLVTQKVITDSLEAVVMHKAATAAVPVKDTTKRGAEGIIVETLPREELYQIQTPQVFFKQLYLNAYKAAEKDYSDDCQLIESLGRSVALSQGDYRNLKLTTAEDFAVAEVFLKLMEEE